MSKSLIDFLNDKKEENLERKAEIKNKEEKVNKQLIEDYYNELLSIS